MFGTSVLGGSHLFEMIVSGAVHDVVQHLVKPVLLRFRVRLSHVNVISKTKKQK